jgi:hypothetical protein
MKYIIFILFLVFTVKVFAIEAYVEINRPQIKIGDVAEASIYVWPVEKLFVIENTINLGENAFFIKTSGPIISENNSEVMIMSGHIVFAKPVRSGEKIMINLNGQDIALELRKFDVIENPEIVLDEKIDIENQEKFVKDNKVITTIAVILLIVVVFFLYKKRARKKVSRNHTNLKFEINNSADLQSIYNKREQIKSQIGDEAYKKLLDDIGDNMYKQTISPEELSGIKDKFKHYGL